MYMQEFSNGLFCFYTTCGMSTTYVTLSKVIECGSKGRTIPLLLVSKV